MTTQQAIQAKIEATERFEAIKYGIRSIELCGSAWGASDCHIAQIEAACQAGAAVLGRDAIIRDNGTLFLLKRAKREATEQEKAAKAAAKAIGSAGQQRLALAA